MLGVDGEGLTLVVGAHFVALLQGAEVVGVAVAAAVAEDLAVAFDVVEVPAVDVALAGPHVLRETAHHT